MYFLKKRLFLILLLLLSNQLYAAPLKLLPEKSEYLDFPIAVLEDASSQLKPEQVFQLEGWQREANRFSKGYTSSSYWFRLQLQNAGQQERKILLQFTEEFFHAVDLYQRMQGQWHLTKNGLHVPVKERALKDALPTFAITLNAGESRDILIRTQSNVGHFGSLVLYSEAEYFLAKEQRNIGYLFLLGALLAILLYNTFLYFQLKEKIYLYYITYGLFFVGWVLLYSGYITLYFSEQFHQYYHVIMPLAFVFLIRFSQELLETQKYQARLHQLLNLSILVYLVAIVTIPFDLRSGFEIHNLITTIAFPLMLFTGIMAIKHKHSMGVFFTLALFAYFLGMTIIGLMALGYLPYNALTRNAPFPGSLIEIVTFSLALAYRINLLKADKMKAQQTLIEVQQQNREILEEKVKQRTFDLEKALKSEQRVLDRYMEFGALIAHEFRNPLGIIKSQISVIKKEKSRNIDNTEKRLKTMEAAVGRLELVFEEWILNDRLNKEAFNPSFKHFTSNHWLESLSDLLCQSHPKHQLLLRGHEIQLYADESLIKIVLFNLVDNACKYSPNGLDVILTTIETQSEVGFEVCDQGKGISDSFKKIMFDPYTRPYGKAEHDARGVGLGLSLTKRIVDAHGGRIAVDSTLNQGTCISVLFPKVNL